MKKIAVLGIHLTYWAGYFLLSLFLYSLIRIGAGQAVKGSLALYYRMFAGFGAVPGLSAFYCFYSILFPRFLNRKKIFLLCVYGFLASVFCGLLGEITLSLALGSVGGVKGGHIFPNYEPSEIMLAIGLTSFVALINGIVGLVTRGFITSYGDIKLKEDLTKKNHEMELALVKSQLNPHFLFNTINNIDVLIAKDADKASEYLNKLSDIMRFMLYETKTELIPLTKELEYIEKYIDLQKIRTANANYVKYVVEGNAANLMIAPMLFIPFIENAFKHSENKKMENAVSIQFVIDKNKITFDCENNSVENALEKEQHSGLGNELIQKRIALLYPGTHALEITNSKNSYHVKLIITSK